MESPGDAPPLHTDAEVLARVEDLVGRATVDRHLWLLFLDGDGRQAPALVPISDVASVPDDDLSSGLARVLVQVLPELATDRGPGSVVFVLERLDVAPVLDADRWADALVRTCERSDLAHRGVFLSTPDAVRRCR